jgi:hypothetical protein
MGYLLTLALSEISEYEYLLYLIQQSPTFVKTTGLSVSNNPLQPIKGGYINVLNWKLPTINLMTPFVLA